MVRGSGLNCVDFDEGDFDYSDDESARDLRSLKAGWEVAVSQSTGKQYYVNTLTNETQYEWPDETARATDRRNARMRGELTSRLPSSRSASVASSQQGGARGQADDFVDDERYGDEDGGFWDDGASQGADATAGTASVALGDVD